MVCVMGSNRPFEIEYCGCHKKNISHKSCDIFFWTVVYVRPMCAKTKHEYWKTLDINWKKKFQLHRVTSSCWFDLRMPILNPMHICFSFLRKIFFCWTSETAIKCTFYPGKLKCSANESQWSSFHFVFF